MSVFGGILLFIVGVAAGLAAAAGIAILLQRLMSQLKRENKHLKESAWRDRLEYETDKAYRTGYNRGYRKGRADPLSDVERLAATIQDKRMDFRGPAPRGGDN